MPPSFSPGSHGKRMGALGEQYPKALLPVGDEPLIGHQLHMFAKLGIREVHVIIGHLGTLLAEVVGTGAAYGVKIHYVEQGPALGSAFALGRAIPYLQKPSLSLWTTTTSKHPRRHR